MFVTIHQPEFFPWAGFFNKILNTDRFVVFDNVKFKLHYFENRCRVMLNRQPTWLTAPVLHKGKGDQPLCEVLVDNRLAWGTKVWKSLYFNYAKAPFWAEHADFLEDVFVTRQWEHLVELNLHVITRYCDYLGIPFNPVLGSEICGDATGADLVLDTCRRAGATAYLSGKFGKEYLDEAAFKAAGIELVYQEFMPPPYPRPDGSPAEPLSILDLCLLHGRGAIDYIKGGP